MEKRFRSGGLAERELPTREHKVKFVVIQKKDDDDSETQAVQIIYLPLECAHSRVVREELGDSDGILIGAGSIEEGLARWDSMSCQVIYGYDRPDDPELSTRLLREAGEGLPELLDQSVDD